MSNNLFHQVGLVLSRAVKKYFHFIIIGAKPMFIHNKNTMLKGTNFMYESIIMISITSNYLLYLQQRGINFYCVHRCIVTMATNEAVEKAHFVKTLL